MKRSMTVAAALALAAVAFVHLVPAGARPDAPANPDEAAIKTMLTGYTAAYNKNDADVVALFFTNDCEYTDDEGRVIRGRDNIRKEYAQLFTAAKGVKIDAAMDSIRKLSADAYAVNGHATITQSDGASKTKYALVVAKRDGSWLIADVREVSTETGAEASPLDALAWMVGEWTDASDDIDVTAICDWTANRHFLMRTHVVTVNGEVELQGTEVIAYDGAAKQIRSWMFDSDGTFTESTWKQDGKSWIATTKGVLADGKRASAVHTYTLVDDNTILYSSTNRDIGGKLQPNVPELKLVRRPAGQ